MKSLHVNNQTGNAKSVQSIVLHYIESCTRYILPIKVIRATLVLDDSGCSHPVIQAGHCCISWQSIVRCMVLQFIASPVA